MSRSRATPFGSRDGEATPESRLLLLPLRSHCGQCRCHTRTTRKSPRWRRHRGIIRRMLPVANAIESICRRNLRQDERQASIGTSKSPEKRLKHGLFLHINKRDACAPALTSIAMRRTRRFFSPPPSINACMSRTSVSTRRERDEGDHDARLTSRSKNTSMKTITSSISQASCKRPSHERSSRLHDDFAFARSKLACMRARDVAQRIEKHERMLTHRSMHHGCRCTPSPAS
jgi:hypothetical protein